MYTHNVLTDYIGLHPLKSISKLSAATHLGGIQQLVSSRSKVKCAYISHVAQVSDTAQVTRQVSLLEINNN